jgi:hypothetical protein
MKLLKYFERAIVLFYIGALVSSSVMMNKDMAYQRFLEYPLSVVEVIHPQTRSLCGAFLCCGCSFFGCCSSCMFHVLVFTL